MPLAIVQTDLADPTTAQLVAAFRALPGLTGHDARLRARDASGVIADRLDEAQARTLLSALARQDVAAAIIDEADLLPLPAAYRSREVRPGVDGLIVFDTLNRPMAFAWAAVTLIAAGIVSDSEFQVVLRGHYAVSKVSLENRSTVEQTTPKAIIDIHLASNPFRVQVDGGRHRYSYLGDGKPLSNRDCYERLVLDLAHHAPHAAINRGADTIIRGVKRRAYRSMRVFEREIAWLTWLTASRE